MKKAVSLSLLLAMVLSVMSPVTALAVDVSGLEQYGTLQVYANAAEENDSRANKTGQVITGIKSTYSATCGGASITLKPKTSGDGTFSYQSDNPNVVAVNSTSGKMTFRGIGTAHVTVAACETKVYGVALEKTCVTTRGKQTISGVASKYQKVYKSGASMTLKAKSSGDGAITYQSSNKSVATVGKTSGKVTMKKRGVCTITVTAAATANYSECTKKITMVQYKKAASLKRSKYYKAGKYYQRLAELKLVESNRENVLEIANSQMGYHEGNRVSHLGGTSSGSGNYTEYGYYYGAQGAWCAMFVNWCARENGTSASVIPRYSAVMNYYTYYHRSGQHFYTWAKTKGGKGSYTPKAGDLIFYSTRLCGITHHIGYVRSCSVGSGKIAITTLEGNSEDQAQMKTYTLKRGSNGRIAASWYISGFSTPKY